MVANTMPYLCLKVMHSSQLIHEHTASHYTVSQQRQHAVLRSLQPMQPIKLCCKPQPSKLCDITSPVQKVTMAFQAQSS